MATRSMSSVGEGRTERSWVLAYLPGVLSHRFRLDANLEVNAGLQPCVTEDVQRDFWSSWESIISPQNMRITCAYVFSVTTHPSQRSVLEDPSVQFGSVAQLCPTLCDPRDRSMPGFPVHHQLLEEADPSRTLNAKRSKHSHLSRVSSHPIFRK